MLRCPQTKPLGYTVRGLLRVRTPPRWSVRVRSTGWCQFSKHSPPGSVLPQQKGRLQPTGFCPGGWGGVRPPTVCCYSLVYTIVLYDYLRQGGRYAISAVCLPCCQPFRMSFIRSVCKQDYCEITRALRERKLHQGRCIIALW